MKRSIGKILAVFLIICISSCRDKKDMTCTDFEYYFTAKYNNEDICYTMCLASIIDNSDSSYSSYKSRYLTELIAGDTSKKVLESFVIILLPEISTCFYKYDIQYGLDYSVAAVYYDKTYSCPNNLNYEKNDFEFNLFTYDTVNKVIEATFRGELISFDDTLSVENGKLRAKFVKENFL